MRSVFKLNNVVKLNVIGRSGAFCGDINKLAAIIFRHSLIKHMQTNWFFLSREKIKCLLTYFILLNVIGITLTLFALIYESVNLPFTLTVSIIAIIGGFGTALIGSSVFYMRKLYKSSINKEMEIPTTDKHKIRELGIFSYYLLRPLFALGFSLLIHITLKSSVHIITVKETRLDEGFLYLSMFLSFFSGFAAGDLITYIESKSEEWITKTFKH